MTNYVKNLIGDWETEQFEPLRQVAQKTYQTNWDKLTNDFNSLNEQLAQNFKNARIQHNNALLENARNSYMRMVNAEQNLANRGLTGSGLLNTYDAMNTQQTGQENNEALQTLMDANKANIEGRFSGLDVYNRNLNDLSGDLLDNLSGITDAEGDNLRNYRNLIADLSESYNSRNSKYSIQSAENDLEEEEQEFYRRKGILETLNNSELSDYEKRKILINEYALVLDNTNKALETMQYLKAVNDYDEYNRRSVKDYFGNRNKKLQEYDNEISKYTYSDLWDLMNK